MLKINNKIIQLIKGKVSIKKFNNYIPLVTTLKAIFISSPYDKIFVKSLENEICVFCLLIS